jgi:hypothetical protein
VKNGGDSIDMNRSLAFYGLSMRLRSVVLGGLLLCCALGSAEAEFVEVTAVAGIDFQHRNGATQEKHAPEAMGSGLAFFDYDGDGWLDLYFVNSAGPGALYRNRGEGSFLDVTEAAGVGYSGFGMGCASADYDNDGDLDLYITSYGPNILYRNNGDGDFTDVAEPAGVGDPGLGVGPAFADYDQDGWVDLYVANYAVYPPDPFIRCYRKGVPIYCGPKSFEPQPDVFYHNKGDGTFVDIAAAVGLLPHESIEFGGVFGDYDNDGDPDLYCPADGLPNLLYRNDGGRFAEVGILAGVAYNDEGKPLSGMGCAVGDYDNDGLTDIYVTNYQWETDSFYRNLGGLLFVDQTYESGVGMPSITYLAWGTIFVDYDRDGHRDLFITTGHHDDNVEEFDAVKYAMQNRLFANDGHGYYRDVSDGAGPGLALVQVSRGAVAGDYDNDGDLDLAVLNSNQPAALLRNDRNDENHWLSLNLAGAGPPCSNRAGIGARVEVIAGDLIQVGEVRSGDSYISQSDLRLFFGLGGREQVERVVIRWPGGTVQELSAVAVDQVLTVREPCASGN